MIATLFRIFIVPVIILLMILRPEGWPLIATLLFVIASITDWLDGYLARRLNSTSTMGKFMDPIADKVLVSSVLIMMIELKMIEALAVLLLINRDVLIGGVRSVAASQGLVIDAGWVGKWKTTVQMIAIPCLLLSQSKLGFLPVASIGYYGLWLSVALSLYSAGQYISRWQKATPTS
jgi:CDP-diacylglycerol--glycerol-3-phosphate 3-phosphatidyltransferase